MALPKFVGCHLSSGSKVRAADVCPSSGSGQILVLTNACLDADRPATLFLHTPAGERISTARVSPTAPCMRLEVTLDPSEGFAFEAVGGALDITGFLDSELGALGPGGKAKANGDKTPESVHRGPGQGDNVKVQGKTDTKVEGKKQTKVEDTKSSAEPQLNGSQPSKPPAQSEKKKVEASPPNGSQSKFANGSDKAKADAPVAAFIAAKKFEGAKPGMVFKKGSKGLGYYKDTYVPPAKGNKRKSEDQPPGQPAAKAAATVPPAKRQITLPSGLKYEVIKTSPAHAQKASRGRTVQVRYDGRLASNGRRFDKGTIKFRLGAGEVIRGWDVGVDGMQVGEKRNLMIPAPLGYGRSGAPPQIPPNAALTFEVELLKIH